ACLLRVCGRKPQYSCRYCVLKILRHRGCCADKRTAPVLNIVTTHYHCLTMFIRSNRTITRNFVTGFAANFFPIPLTAPPPFDNWMGGGVTAKEPSPRSGLSGEKDNSLFCEGRCATGWIPSNREFSTIQHSPRL